MNNFYNINNCNLDDTQINAIESEYTNTLVVAGAGSGKTLTILGKIKYLIEKKDYKENEILCISFTNESVKSLKNKLTNLGYNIDVYTFHKLSLNILSKYNYSLINDNYLEYITDEYFKSFIKYNNKRKRYLKHILYTNNNIDNIFNTNEYYNLKKTIITFIHLAKSNNIDINNIYNFYKKSLFNEKKLLRIILEIYHIYEVDLSSAYKLDFDDLIVKATDEVKNNKINYKYIIIDEFQDTSLVRLNLIKEIIKYTNSKLFVVGDDFQSIYRFSGCNLDIFINFNKYFNNTKYYYLKYTYRNSNELIRVSTDFVMKNPKQLKKHIVSHKNLKRPIKIVFNKDIYEIIKLINDTNDLLILGRNNYDINNINYDYKLTIHKSKGLEANNIIIVNSDDIPSMDKNSKIIRYVLPNKDYILFEEERRLFYVALTRTKNYVYIQVNKKISPFVKELISYYKDFIEIIR